MLFPYTIISMVALCRIQKCWSQTEAHSTRDVDNRSSKSSGGWLFNSCTAWKISSLKPMWNQFHDRLYYDNGKLFPFSINPVVWPVCIVPCNSEWLFSKFNGCIKKSMLTVKLSTGYRWNRWNSITVTDACISTLSVLYMLHRLC